MSATLPRRRPRPRRNYPVRPPWRGLTLSTGRTRPRELMAREGWSSMVRAAERVRTFGRWAASKRWLRWHWRGLAVGWVLLVVLVLLAVEAGVWRVGG